MIEQGGRIGWQAQRASLSGVLRIFGWQRGFRRGHGLADAQHGLHRQDGLLPGLVPPRIAVDDACQRAFLAALVKGLDAVAIGVALEADNVALQVLDDVCPW